MRTLLTALMVLAALTFAYAGPGCGGKTGCGGCGGAKTAATVPDCAPQQLVTFHATLTPMLEACNSGSDSYIREHARELHEAAHNVVKSEKCCEAMKAKPYRQAAKTLKKDTDRLQSLSKKGDSAAVLAQMKVIESDFTTLTGFCE